MDLLENIKSLNENSNEDDIMGIVEFDFKNYTQYSECQNSIERFFEWKNDQSDKRQAEKYDEALGIYEALGWINGSANDSIDFDAITSFINIYAFALLKFYSEDFIYNEKLKAVQVKQSSKFQLANSNKYLEKRYKKFTIINEMKCISDLARLIHSFGNFMPCPTFILITL